MSKYRKQGISYFRLDSKIAQKLDRRIVRAGYTSRSDFFTAVAYVALYGVETEKQPLNTYEHEAVENLPEPVVSWIRETMPRISEEEILAGLHAVIEEMLLPVVAMKGVDIAYENTWEDVREVFHSRTGVWVTESDLREAYLSFATVRKAELAEYRERQLHGDLEEDGE